MGVELNGIAHIQLTVNDPRRGIPFWERLCHFLGMQTLVRGDEVVYCIGGRTGILVRGAATGTGGGPFHQDRAGLHHFCLRARSREDVDAIYHFLVDELGARIVHPPEDSPQFAEGYYSLLFEDPDGIRVEVNHVPGKGHFGDGGRLGPGGTGPAARYGSDGLTGGGASVESTLSYLADIPERPFFYAYEPPPGTPRRNTKGDRRTVAIRDARALASRPSLDVEGFLLAPLETSVEDLYDAEAVRARYYPEVEELVKGATGAVRVVAFDHNVRCAPMAERRENDALAPVRFPHNDYTEGSGPQRVRDLFPAEADALLARRFAVINVWKPIRGRVEELPLAVCDARTIRPEDLVTTDLRYRDRVGEVYSLRFNPAHRWFYYPRMHAREAMLLKCFDSDPARARFTAHTAFVDPTSPPDAPPRESIEVRTLAFFAASPE